MGLLAFIGGSGLDSLPDLAVTELRDSETPYGKPSAPVALGRLGDIQIAFLPRHGTEHSIAPHQINYRANLAALADLGVDRIIAIAAVGGISAQMAPPRLVIPDQLIDYTWSREHTFSDGTGTGVVHVDFTHPFCAILRSTLSAAAINLNVTAIDGAVYGAMQGPRLETAAEINRMERDGCDIVGMTVMPEAALARELDIRYAVCALIVNWAAGRSTGVIEHFSH